MTSRSLFGSRRFLVTVVLLCVVSAWAPLGLARSVAALPHHLLVALVSPVTVLLKTAADAVGGGQPRLDLGEHEELYDHYTQALQYIRRLESDLRQREQQLAQLMRVREIRGEQGIRAYLPARVTSYSGEPARPVLTIDRGTSDGVRRGMVVVSGANLVGLVEAVGPLTADVRLITTPGTTLDVRFAAPTPPAAPPSAPTYLATVGLAEDGRRFVHDEAPQNVPVRAGDLAHLDDQGGRWPAQANGFIVGQVAEVAGVPDNPLLLKRIVIEPLIRPPSLRRVWVLVPAEDEGDG